MRRTGDFQAGDRVQLTDPKGRKYTVLLEPGKSFFTTYGGIAHNDLIGKPEGSAVLSTGNMTYLALRPLLTDFVLSMPRGAAVIYPKDAAVIVGFTDIFPGATVVEAGVGSGALSCSLIRAIGNTGHLHSFERREDFAEIAKKNVKTFFGEIPPNWDVHLGDLQEAGARLSDSSVDRVVLDMLAPWECLTQVSRFTRSGGVLMIYVATTTQMSTVIEAIRESKNWTDPHAEELIQRPWHVEGLAVRPDHRMQGHTGFLITTRRLAQGTVLPPRRVRPAKGDQTPNLEVKSEEGE